MILTLIFQALTLYPVPWPWQTNPAWASNRADETLTQNACAGHREHPASLSPGAESIRCCPGSPWFPSGGELLYNGKQTKPNRKVESPDSQCLSSWLQLFLWSTYILSLGFRCYPSTIIIIIIIFKSLPVWTNSGWGSLTWNQVVLTYERWFHQCLDMLTFKVLLFLESFHPSRFEVMTRVLLKPLADVRGPLTTSLTAAKTSHSAVWYQRRGKGHHFSFLGNCWFFPYLYKQ